MKFAGQGPPKSRNSLHSETLYRKLLATITQGNPEMKFGLWHWPCYYSLPSNTNDTEPQKKRLADFTYQLKSIHPIGVAVPTGASSPPKGERDASHDPPLALSPDRCPDPGDEVAEGRFQLAN